MSSIEFKTYTPEPYVEIVRFHKDGSLKSLESYIGRLYPTKAVLVDNGEIGYDLMQEILNKAKELGYVKED